MASQNLNSTEKKYQHFCRGTSNAQAYDTMIAIGIFFNMAHKRSLSIYNKLIK